MSASLTPFLDLDAGAREEPIAPLPLPPAVEILRLAYKVGCRIARDGDQMRLLVPPGPGSLPAAFLQELRAHRSEILEILTTHACSGCGRFAFPEPQTLCFWCRRGPCEPLAAPLES